MFKYNYTNVIIYIYIHTYIYTPYICFSVSIPRAFNVWAKPLTKFQLHEINFLLMKFNERTPSETEPSRTNIEREIGHRDFPYPCSKSFLPKNLNQNLSGIISIFRHFTPHE